MLPHGPDALSSLLHNDCMTNMSTACMAVLRSVDALIHEQETQSVAWRDLVSSSQQGHKRTMSIASLLKADRRAFEISSLIDVRAGSEQVRNNSGQHS